MRIQALASKISDNWMFLVLDGDDAMLVDPFDAETAAEAVRVSGAHNVFVFTTHGHPDHVGGNAAVQRALGCKTYGPSHSKVFPHDYDVLLSDGDTITVGTTSFDIIHAPGHTDGHIIAYTPGHVISGDVYFVAGAGNCRFGGDPCELHRTFTERLSSLPDDTVFYPGHDYAQKNLAFCLEIEPDNAEAARRHELAAAHSRAAGPTLTTLGEERSYNPFHRTGEPELQNRLFEAYPTRHADCADPSERAFRILRTLRDDF